MLSYQHAYHAGNAADLHKHAVLAFALEYLVRKDKPLSYLETHAGRGLYDLSAPEAIRTGEAAAGVGSHLERLAADHPLRRVVSAVRAEHGATAYPGSPLIAEQLLRKMDHRNLAELHPGEHAALLTNLPGAPNLRIHKRDGLEMAKALTPPDPRRGLMLIDPSWEIRSDYARLAKLLPLIHRKWPVGILMTWYPILPDRRHGPMVRAWQDLMPEIMIHEVLFPPARDGHGMQGSGLAIVNPPWGLDAEADRLTTLFEGD
ncbi:MAG: 23S rRNA (adenine(2030)-N(6))-methyltransferase RlmJ [Pseudomonadota bacterium]